MCQSKDHVAGRDSGFVSLTGLVRNMDVADKNGAEMSFPPGYIF